MRDSARLLQVMAGRDEMDSTSAFAPVPDYVAALDGNIRGMKIGVPKEFFDGLASDTGDLIQAAIQTLQKLGCEIREIRLPHTAYAVGCYYIIATAEASSNLARYDGVRYTRRSEAAGTLQEMYRKTRDEGFGAECKRRIMLGTYVLSAGYYDAYYLKAQKVRALVARDYAQAFEQVDAIVGPVSPLPGVQAGREGGRSDVHVSFRHLHRDGRPGGHPLHERAGREDRRKDCRWGCRSWRITSTKPPCFV